MKGLNSPLIKLSLLNLLLMLSCLPPLLAQGDHEYGHLKAADDENLTKKDGTLSVGQYPKLVDLYVDDEKFTFIELYYSKLNNPNTITDTFYRRINNPIQSNICWLHINKTITSTGGTIPEATYFEDGFKPKVSDPVSWKKVKLMDSRIPDPIPISILTEDHSGALKYFSVPFQLLIVQDLDTKIYFPIYVRNYTSPYNINGVYHYNVSVEFEVETSARGRHDPIKELYNISIEAHPLSKKDDY